MQVNPVNRCEVNWHRCEVGAILAQHLALQKHSVIPRLLRRKRHYRDANVLGLTGLTGLTDARLNRIDARLRVNSG